MKLSRQWLQEAVELTHSDADLAHLLTRGGLEVEAIEPVAPPFTRVVIGQVLTCEKHPQADRLKLCTVRVFEDSDAAPLQIVCGAPNVAVGLKVPCAMVGAHLPGIEIKEAKVRGIASQGMLCSAKELGISEAAEGLLVLPEDAPVGASIRDYLQLDDTVFTLKLTPNRGDCLSLKGLAREVAAVTGAAFNMPPIPAVAATLPAPAGEPIVLAAGAACPIYFGRVIRLATRPAESPAWLRRRLERSGLRPIDPVVDATNYGLITLGHPTHAFDHDKLKGPITVRFGAPSGTDALTLLNGDAVTVRPDTLLVTDANGPVALAGVMGGLDSSVTADTREILLECAWFAPDAVAGRARQYGLNSEAAHRFERGVDPAGIEQAMEFVTALLIELCGGEAGPILRVGTPPAGRERVKVRLARINRVLGLAFDAETVAGLLTRLGLQFDCVDEVFDIMPPSYRFDLAIEADFIEEVARLFGYDHIPGIAPTSRLRLLPTPEGQRNRLDIARGLVGRDYQEVITYSFVEPDWERDFAANTHPVAVINPIAAQMSVMRSTLFGGLVSTLSFNLKRKQDRVRLFEVGRTFRHQEAGQAGAGSAVTADLPYAQIPRMGLLAYGSVAPEQWGATGRRVDFFDVKGDLEALLPGMQCRPANHPALHPGRSAEVVWQGRVVGQLGELHPRLLPAYDLAFPPVLAEIEVDALLSAKIPRFSEPSRFPAVRRDIAVIVAESTPAGALLEALNEARGACVTDISLFDLYKGVGLPEGQKSLAFRIVMQDTARTLTDEEIDSVTSGMIKILVDRFNAELRK